MPVTVRDPLMTHLPGAHEEGYDYRERNTVGKPDGVAVWRPEFGCKVETFTRRRADLDDIKFRTRPCIMFHVPFSMRGPYKPEQLANFDGEADIEVDHEGFVMCNQFTKAQLPCKRRASNRQPTCEAHGARLHPLDKVVGHLRRDPATMTRYELFREGYLDAEDLTDDELMGGLSPKGGKLTLPKAQYQKLVARTFERAQQLMQAGLLPAIEALSDIAANQHEIYEASDRIKASIFIIERVMGKTPDRLEVGVSKEPWQQLVSSLAENSRAESRAARGLDAEGRPVLEAEVVEAPVQEQVPTHPSLVGKRVVRRDR